MVDFSVTARLSLLHEYLILSSNNSRKEMFSSSTLQYSKRAFQYNVIVTNCRAMITNNKRNMKCLEISIKPPSMQFANLLFFANKQSTFSLDKNWKSIFYWNNGTSLSWNVMVVARFFFQLWSACSSANSPVGIVLAPKPVHQIDWRHQQFTSPELIFRSNFVWRQRNKL